MKKHYLLAICALNNGLVPILIGSTLAIWLKEKGVSLQSIGLYSLAQMPFAFGFVLAIILEFITNKKLISHKNLLILISILSGCCLFFMKFAINNSSYLFIACFVISLLASCSRILLTTVQKLLFTNPQIPAATNTSTIGTKAGFIIGGSLALYLSQFFLWGNLYQFYASIIILGGLSIYFIPNSYFNFHLADSQLTIKQQLAAPWINLYKIPGIWLILLLMFFYRMPDNLITHYFELYYLHLGISKTQVSLGYKLYGLVLASIAGILCAKIYKYENNYTRLLIASLILHMASYFVIYTFGFYPHLKWLFFSAVSLEEFTRGMTMLSFWGYQTYICNRETVMVQLTVLIGIDSLSYNIMSTLGGSIIEHFGYHNLILSVIASSIPAFILLGFLYRQERNNQTIY